ncbi:MAG: hypothetical protein IPL39_08995 [Opitutaceae bacterium]|nr:hypothetical protein [Opitutaceae bacterium]
MAPSRTCSPFPTSFATRALAKGPWLAARLRVAVGVMLCALAFVPAAKAETDGDFTYTVVGDTATITDYSGYTFPIGKIPATLWRQGGRCDRTGGFQE